MVRCKSAVRKPTGLQHELVFILLFFNAAMYSWSKVDSDAVDAMVGSARISRHHSFYISVHSFQSQFNHAHSWYVWANWYHGIWGLACLIWLFRVTITRLVFESEREWPQPSGAQSWCYVQCMIRVSSCWQCNTSDEKSCRPLPQIIKQCLRRHDSGSPPESWDNIKVSVVEGVESFHFSTLKCCFNCSKLSASQNTSSSRL